MTADSKAVRKPWLIVGGLVLVGVLLFLFVPQATWDSMVESLRQAILKLHGAPPR